MPYDPNTGFRNGSLAQRSPGAYFVLLGVIYSGAWFVLSFLGGHHRSGGVIVAEVFICVLFGAMLAGLHFASWRWRLNRDKRTGTTS